MTSHPKRPRDPFQLAKKIGDIATGQTQDAPPADAPPKGRAGGLKGGVVRATALSKEKRVEIAKKAARTRWKVEAEDSSE